MNAMTKKVAVLLSVLLLGGGAAVTVAAASDHGRERGHGAQGQGRAGGERWGGEDEDEDEDEEGGEEDRGRAREGEQGHGGGRAGGAAGGADPVYVKECGACHLAYPPRLLPARSWQTMMRGLDRHFGQNAELDEATRGGIERWLVAAAGPDRGEAPSRISELGWFRHEHRKASAAVGRPSVASLAQCGACHPGAERWDFDEDRAKIPAR